MIAIAVFGDHVARFRRSPCPFSAITMRRFRRSPWAETRSMVEVLVGDYDVVIYDGGIEVARHRRCTEPHRRVVDARHFAGIYRQRDEADVVASSPIGRSLDVYADFVGDLP